MTPAPSEPVALINRLRQQLILAQVRVMEIEDERDALAPRLTETSRLLADAQQLADAKLAEAAHLEKVRTDLQAQYEHMRHMQHVTHLELERVRQEVSSLQTELGGAAARLRQEQQLSADCQARLAQATGHAASLEARLSDLHRQLADTQEESARRHERLTQLDAEVRALKASRSWRWTAWLRTLERTFAPKR